MTKRALLGLVLEQGRGHKMILPSLVSLSHAKVIVADVGPRPSAFQVERMPAQARTRQSSWLFTVASGRWWLRSLPSRLPSELSVETLMLLSGRG